MPPPTPKQSRYEGARRPWSTASAPAKRGPYFFKEDPEEIRTCLSCPLPDCRPVYCPILRKTRAETREPGVPRDFRIRLDLGDSTAALAERYNVTRRTVSLWKQRVRAEDAK